MSNNQQNSATLSRANNNNPLYPIPAAIRYRKRVRETNENYQSLSPNINNSLKRQRRKLSSPTSIHELNNKSNKKASEKQINKLNEKLNRNRNRNRNSQRNTKSNRNTNLKTQNVEDWSETDQENSYTDADADADADANADEHYSLTQSSGSVDSSDSSDSDSDSATVVGYRKLNWRKNQVATPKFIIIDNDSILLTPLLTPLDGLTPSASTIDMYGILGDKLEDTTNKAYFYRHYRAEAREKLFYEELFESRLKQQQILEEKEKRKKNKKKQRKMNNNNTIHNTIHNTINNTINNTISNTTINNDVHDIHMNVNNSGSDDMNMIDANINGDINDMNDMNDTNEMLELPKLPSGPWSYKLGSEYDKRPNLPKNVTNIPTFNYNIPFKQLKRRQSITDIQERKKLDNWWQIPQNLIRRTDYGNMTNVKVKINPNLNNNNNNNNNNKEHEIKQKQELIELYQQLKQAEKLKKSDDKKVKKARKKKQKQKQKQKHKRNKHNKHSKHKHAKGPIDVRLLLKK